MPVKNGMPTPDEFPSFSLQHVRRLTDNTGIIQHACFCIPNLKEGYCLDDNARALLMVLMAIKQKKQQGLAMEMLPVYLSYIHYMQNNDGTFRNFLSFSRQHLDEVGSEDAFGRTIWALGYLLANSPNDGYYQAGKEIFFRALQQFNNLTHIRGIANTIIGISYYLKNSPGDNSMHEVMKGLAYRLLQQYNANKAEGWQWFEPQLTYDNAVLPLSLLHATEILHDDALLQAGVESLEFLSGLTFKGGCLCVIGNKDWYFRQGEQSVFAQQPLDVMMMVLLYKKAWQVTKDKAYFEKLSRSHMWFLGENDLRISLVDNETKGCSDGLEHYGVNRNQGAESTLAYLVSHLTVLQAFEQQALAENTVVEVLPHLGHANGFVNGTHNNAAGNRVKAIV